ncbi:MAG: metal-dependent hydrolase, partial [Tepidimonas sp.]
MSARTPLPPEFQPAAAPHAEPQAAVPRWRHPRANREVELHGVRVAYEFRRSARRTIGLLVGPCGLSVRAPRWADWTVIEGFLHHKAAWVLAQLHRQAARAARPRPVWP